MLVSLHSGNSECRGAGKRREGGPHYPESDRIAHPVPCVPELDWEWVKRGTTWFWGGKGVEVFLLHIHTISIFMVCFIPPKFEVLGLLWFEVSWAFRKVNLIGRPKKELGCSFLHCFCQVTNHSSICFPSSPKCVDVLHLLLSPLLLSLSLWIYTFFPPIPMVGFREEVEIN